MKILVVLGGALLSHPVMVDSFKSAIPSKAFPGHEVVVATPQEAINSYFDLVPDGIIFAGLRDLKDAGNTSELVRSILISTIGGDSRKYILAAPLVVDSPKWREMFGVEAGDTNPDNLFRLDNWEGMKSWFGIS